MILHLVCWIDLDHFLEEGSDHANPESEAWSSILSQIAYNEKVLPGLDLADSQPSISAKCNGKPSMVQGICKGVFKYSGTEGKKSVKGVCRGTYISAFIVSTCQGTATFASTAEGPYGKRTSSHECVGSKSFSPLKLKIKGHELQGYSLSCTGTASYKSDLFISGSAIISPTVEDEI